MKCPKCAYVSHDYLDACRNSKCGIDLIDFKAQMQLHAVQAGTISLMSLLGNSHDHAAVASGTHNSLFDSQMLVETSNTGDFDISLDDDFSLASTSISIDESADSSGMFDLSNLNFDINANTSGAATGGRDSSSVGPPTSGYATIMLDVGSFEDPNVSQDDDGASSDPPTPGYTTAPLDVGDLDLGETSHDSDRSSAPPFGQDLFAEIDLAAATSESVDAEIIPWQHDEAELTVAAGESSLLDNNTNLDQRAAPSSKKPQSDKLLFQTDEIQLPPIPEKELTLVDTLDATAIDDTNSPTLADEVFELPTPPTQDRTLDATAIDDANSPTLADEVFELPTPPTQETTLVDTIDASAINEVDVPTLTDHEERFELPPLPNPQELSLTSTLDETVVDEFTEVSQDGLNTMQLLDESFELPPLINSQEFTLANTFDETVADVSTPALPGNPLTPSIPLDKDAFELPPPPVATELLMPEIQNETIIDESNAVTIADATFELPPPLTQEITLVETQEVAAVEPPAPPLDNRTRSIPLEDVAFELPPPPTETELQRFEAQDETVIEDSPLSGFHTNEEALSQPLPSQIDDDSDLLQSEDEELRFDDEPPRSS